jgi:hypothetical protein
VDLIDRVIFRKIKNFLGLVGVEVGIEDPHTLYAVFYVLFNDGNLGYVKWNLNETLLLDNVSWKQQETLHEKANNVIPVAYREWLEEVGYRPALKISFNTLV